MKKKVMIVDDSAPVRQQVGLASSELTTSASKAHDMDARMNTRVKEAERKIGADLDRLLSAFDGAQQTTAAAARVGVQRARHVVELTNDILSHLQFQDRMAQVLGEAQ